MKEKKHQKLFKTLLLNQSIPPLPLPSLPLITTTTTSTTYNYC